jgi:D-psicose/D-tagatose/L-ribulose 3-epimerase
MNKIGFNVLAWSAVVSTDLFPILERLKAIGYDSVEFFVGGADADACKLVGKKASDLGLDVSTVTVVSREANPVDASPKVREMALHSIKDAIDRSYELGSKVLCGPIHSAHAFMAGHEPFDSEYSYAAEVLHKAGEYAQTANMVLGLEALNRFETYLCNTMDQLKRLIEETNHSHVKAMFDTHHANMEEKTFEGAIAHIAPYLHHVHISENDRGTPGFGHIQFDATFSSLAAINYSGRLTIEAFSRNDPNFANAINVWREYNDPWHIAENGYTFIKNMCQKHGL